MMIENFEYNKIVLYLQWGNMMHLETILDHLNFFWTPLKPPFVPLSSPSYRKGVSIINTVTSKIPKCYGYKLISESHFDTPELIIGPLNLLKEIL